MCSALMDRILVFIGYPLGVRQPDNSNKPSVRVMQSCRKDTLYN